MSGSELSELSLIVGLGNPGPKYNQTRHNAGFWFLDALSDDAPAGYRERVRLSAALCRIRFFDKDCILAKPTTYMNNCGRAVRAVMDYYNIETKDVLVVYDDLDLPPGIARLKQGGGHGGHNGMRDIFRHLENTDFMRLRIGIGHPGHKDAVTGYVLSRAPVDQERLIMESIGTAVSVIPDVLTGQVARATKSLHTRGVAPA